MGGRGTFASGVIVPYRYATIGRVGGIKVLVGVGGKHNLPEEAHSSSAYARLNKDGSLREIRFYDRRHNVRLEIARHVERGLDPSGKPVLHYHTYQPGFEGRSPAIRLTEAMMRRYGRLFERSWR